MRSMKRTTLILEEGCMAAVRELAHREGRTLTAMVNELLTEAVLRRRNAPSESTFELPGFEMGEPRIHLGDRDALETLLKE